MKFGSRNETELRFVGYYLKPDRIADMSRLKDRDNRAVREIAELEAMIEAVKGYRLQLAERAAQLATMGSHKRVTLKRERRDSVKFYLMIETVYEDGTSVSESSKVFPGSERAAAIKEYKKLVKDNPHWESVLDIEKGRWER